ncbi:protein-export chaperone SecB [Thioflexithrix psekupsensis]|uniref:Protein-export protein SecB n=1 Tax=Thioflexithrix psekupsensis TaxID=1570016 RepID=A0A251XB40_9GAMM|nr:protein-export chaperone SecB [Thioflexithrix psekupsensis]
MNDTVTTPEAAATETPREQFVLQKIYVKDISFEAPNTPQVFTEKWEPKTHLEIGTKGMVLGQNNYEVGLTVTVTVTINDKTAFLVEVHQAGIFALVGFEAGKLDYMLNAYCPSILFPYLREAVSDVVTRGGFQPLLLAPVNFDAYYEQRVRQMQAQQNAGTAEAPTNGAAPN